MLASRVFLSFVFVVATVARKCENITIPLKISSRNGVFDVVLSSSLDAITFMQNLTRAGGNFTNDALRGYQNVEQAVDIAAQYCVPEIGGRTVQLLTHGTGANKEYWDTPTVGGRAYSYVDVALEHGYSTLAIDRLGCGDSSVADPIQQVQVPSEIAITREISRLLRSGSVPGISGHKFSKVVHIGHSYGSSITLSFGAFYPEESDGLVLTGFSGNATFLPLTLVSLVPVLARDTDLPRFKKRPAGYLTWPGSSVAQFAGFDSPNFDPEVLGWSEANRSPFPVGALLSGGLGTFLAPNFKGPVFVVAGERDVPACGGNCFATAGTGLSSIPAGAKVLFPGASAFQAEVQRGSGHNLNWHFNATGGYEVIQGFLRRQGLE